MGDEMDQGQAKLRLHNASQSVDALETKFRKRTTRIKALRIELDQLERSMPRLTERIGNARAEVRSARSDYRRLKKSEEF